MVPALYVFIEKLSGRDKAAKAAGKAS
jgi:hypothetical protein